MSKIKHYLLITVAAVFLLTGCRKHPQTPVTTTATEMPVASISPSPQTSSSPEASASSASVIPEDTKCDDKACVAEYLSVYWHLPSNFMKKSEARQYGWDSGSLSRVVEGMAIGGDEYKNRDESLPTQYRYEECDLNTIGKKKRGAERMIYSVEGKLIYYTGDHYETFELLYGEE